MTIDSVAGQGVHFQIRSPFSVFGAQSGADGAVRRRAVRHRLDIAEGIVRVMPNELEGYYQLNPPPSTVMAAKPTNCALSG